MNCTPTNSKIFCILAAAMLLIAFTPGCSSEPDQSGNGNGDPDAGTTNDTSDEDTSDEDACEPISDEQLCEDHVNRCGEVILEDNCGVDRTVDCGSCGDGFKCDDGFCVDVECFNDFDCPVNHSCDDGECVQGPSGFNTVLIEDRTFDQASTRCNDNVDDYDTAGAKIMWVALWQGGASPSYATAHDWEDGQNAQFGDYAEVINGTDPGFVKCPGTEGDSPFNEGEVVAMGCGGWLLVRFYDNTGNVIDLYEGDDIAVGEFGPQCNAELQSGNDYYDISVCLSGIGEPPISISDINDYCDLPLNSAPLTGMSDVSVSF